MYQPGHHELARERAIIVCIRSIMIGACLISVLWETERCCSFPLELPPFAQQILPGSPVAYRAWSNLYGANGGPYVRRLRARCFLQLRCYYHNGCYNCRGRQVFGNPACEIAVYFSSCPPWRSPSLFAQ